MKKNLLKAKQLLKYLIYLGIFIIIIDVVVFRSILGITFPQHYKRTNHERYPAPYIMFTGKPVLPHNKSGFRAKEDDEFDPTSYKIAFWGGSTGYAGNPPIPGVIEKELSERLDFKVEVYNFSISSSNHRQHLHGLLEYHNKFVPDLVIFYGGYNETIQQAFYDPRPGYPYNYYYRSQLSELQRLLLNNSAILAVYESKTHKISGLNQLQEWWNPFSEIWTKEIVDKYFETLELAKGVTATIDSSQYGATDFLAFYQPYQVPDTFRTGHEKIRERITMLDYVYDVSYVYDSMEVKPYVDIVHVNQEARNIMGDKMTEIIYDHLSKTLSPSFIPDAKLEDEQLPTVSSE